MPTTRVLDCRPKPDPAALAEAAAVLRRGGLVAFPTETVYGLGANALDGGAARAIYAAKGRPSHNPLIVHVADAGQVAHLVSAFPAPAARLAEAFWPGPLTLVLPKSSVIPAAVTAGGPTVAVRVPAHPVAQALLTLAGVPVAAPSANRSERLSPTTAAHVLADLGGRIDVILDGGPTAGGIESTVVDVTGDVPRILRPGLISPTDLEAVVGRVEWSRHALGEGPAHPSPGMSARHYAPRTRLEWAADGSARVRDLSRRGVTAALVTTTIAEDVPPGTLVVVLPDDAPGFAARLYAALHDLDAAGVSVIVVTGVPDGPAWLGVRDRLRRASVDTD